VQPDYKSRLNILKAALPLTAILLGTLAKPASADIGSLVSQINSYRQSNGLSTLNEDQNLTNAACWLAADLDKNSFDHTDSQGRSMSQRLTDFGVSGSTGENIFWTTAGSSASYVLDGWKNSTGHNEIMLNPTYTRIGVAMINTNGRWYWAADFANGSAISLTNQCGVVINPPPPPPTQLSPPPTAVNPSAQTVEVPVSITESTSIATISAEPTILDTSTRSATLSSRTVKFGSESAETEKPISLVKGLALGSVILWNLTLFGLIFWKLSHHFRLPT